MPIPLNPMNRCFTGRSNEIYLQYHSACSTAQTATTQAFQKNEWRRKQKWTTKQRWTSNSHVYEETSGKEDPTVMWGSGFNGRKTIIHRKRRHNWNSSFHLLQRLVLNKGRKTHQCQCKCQTPMLRIIHQSRSQRSPESRKLAIHQKASKHPAQGVLSNHQRNMDTNKTSEVTFTMRLVKDAAMTSAEWPRTMSI